MLTYMRTTLVIEDAVYLADKRRALEVGLTLSDLTTQAPREALRSRTPETPSARFSMPVQGGGAIRATSSSEMAALRDEG